MVITKKKEFYVVEQDGGTRTIIKTYRNPYHMNHCYVEFDLDTISGVSEVEIFQTIADEEKCPLQVMLSSLEIPKAHYLASHGFKKVRKCYEMVVTQKDLLATVPFQKSRVS